MSLLARRRGVVSVGGAVTVEFLSVEPDGELESRHSSYATAVAGGGTVTGGASTTVSAGQQFGSGEYLVGQGFIGFDTSSIPDTATITEATLSMYTRAFGVVGTFTVQARTHDWGDTITSADWVPDLSALTLLASTPSSSLTADQYTAFTSEAALVSAINKSGHTRMVIGLASTAAATWSGSGEAVQFWAALFGEQMSKLTVTYTLP